MIIKKASKQKSTRMINFSVLLFFQVFPHLQEIIIKLCAFLVPLLHILKTQFFGVVTVSALFANSVCKCSESEKNFFSSLNFGQCSPVLYIH